MYLFLICLFPKTSGQSRTIFILKKISGRNQLYKFEQKIQNYFPSEFKGGTITSK
jgi:hypothetical protein